MTRMTIVDTETAKAVAAREQFIGAYMADVPAELLVFVPVTNSGVELLKAHNAVYEMWQRMADALAREQHSPWLKTSGPRSCKLVDFTGIDGKALVTTGLNVDRMLGIPAPIKNGRDPDGKLFREYPDVVAAIANAPKTAEWAAQDRVKEAQDAQQAATHAYVPVANGDAPGDAEALRKVMEDADAAVEAAQRELNRLRANPAEGCRLIK